jgi:hypothetical protein
MTESTPPRQFYERRATEIRQTAAELAARDRTLSMLRGAVVLLFVVTAWAVFDPSRLALGWLGVPVAIFIGLVVAHERCARQRARTHRALRFYEQGLARLDGTWAGHGPEGTRFADEAHPYADDLDIFGEGSLFQLICTARTPAGRARLADWLKAPTPTVETQRRQQAVAELAPRTQLREEILVLGAEVGPRTHPEALAAWAAAPPRFAAASTTRLVARALASVTLLVMAAVVAGLLSRYYLIGALLLQSAFALRLRGAVLAVIDDVEIANRELGLLHEILGRFETETFESALLQDLMKRLHASGRPPSGEIGRLRRLVDLLDARRNQFFAPLGALLLWGTQFAAAIEHWRAGSGAAVAEWLDVIAEVEALDSLAAYHYEHPDDPFPDLIEGPATFVGAELGHPLLTEADCVRNDVTLTRDQQVLIVSGSNMSGKSTLMRTVGINAVLAQAGAPVRATALRLSPLQVGGSIRVRDSLRQGMSGFYAEISRFRSILDLAEKTPPVLFLLEEILHTTNSHDRRIGAEALLRSLLSRGAIGLVTTHDLAITDLAGELDAATNVHFVDELVDGAIRFDYKLRSGVVQRSNAVELMREIGLDV